MAVGPKRSEAKAALQQSKPITIVDTAAFEGAAKKLFSEPELERLRDYVARFRELGAVIPDTGGVRKLRWASQNNRGKSSGARIIYYFLDDDFPLYLIAAYAKNKKSNLSEAEKKAARKFVDAIKSARAHSGGRAVVPPMPKRPSTGRTSR